MSSIDVGELFRLRQHRQSASRSDEGDFYGEHDYGPEEDFVLHLPPSIEDERDPAEEPDRAGALAPVSIADDQTFYGRLRVCICVLVLCLCFCAYVCVCLTCMHVCESDLQRK